MNKELDEFYKSYSARIIAIDDTPSVEVMDGGKFKLLSIEGYEEMTNKIAELQKQLEEKEKLLQYGMNEIKNLNKRINDIVKRDEKLLKSQPREIVEKIKKQIFNHFNVKNMEEYENLSLIDGLFTADAVIEMLDTILKEYQK